MHATTSSAPAPAAAARAPSRIGTTETGPPPASSPACPDDAAPLAPPLWLAGEPCVPTRRFAVRSPWRDMPLGVAPSAEPRHVDHALERARHYARAPLAEGERAALLERWAEALLAEHERLARLVARESGKTLGNARTEVVRAAATARGYAAAARTLNAAPAALGATLGAPIDAARLDVEGLLVATLHRPLGVVAAFTPFNFPVNTVVHKVAAAIAAGNAIVLKPSEKTPLAALELGRLLAGSDAPEGIASVLSGHWSNFVGPFLHDRRVDFFTMTGHSAVGRALYRRFTDARPFHRCHFELGGNAPQLVLEDIDPDQAAARLVEAVFDHNGSRCTTPRKILVPAGDWAERFLEAAVARAAEWRPGDPLAPGTRLGPLIDEAAARAVGERVADAVARGARRLAGGARRGTLFEATVLADVRPGMRVFDEENFGPVMCVLPCADVESMLELAALGDYGLQPAVMTADLAHGWTLAARLRGGTVNVGPTATTSSRSDLTPFGGIGASGIGKEGGLAGVREMCHEVPIKLHPQTA